MDETRNLKIGPDDLFDGCTFMEKTRQPSPQEPVTEEEVVWLRTNSSADRTGHWTRRDALVHRLIRNRARAQERIAELEAALRKRVSEQSGHFLDCSASEEIIHFQEAQPGSCTCADDLAILAVYDKLEGKA